MWISDCKEVTSTTPFTHTVYFCNGVRVTGEGYAFYQSKPGYTCTSEVFTNRIGCWCRKDAAGKDWGANLEVACKIQIIEPDFTKPCRNKDFDSAFYTYSIPGYDPCHWIDVNQKLTLTYKLNCYNENYKQLKEWWGITYDGVTPPTTDFSYLIDDPNQQLVLSNSTKFDVEFRLQNWKWLSDSKLFKSTITTVDQLYGCLLYTSPSPRD